jgi:hypothetical protein
MLKFTDQVKIANNLSLLSADDYTVHFRVDEKAYNTFKEKQATVFN